MYLSITGFAQSNLDYLSVISSQEDFQILQGAPLSSKYGEVTSLKVVYSTETDEIYFFNAQKYIYHIDFCEAVLMYNKGGYIFNHNMYTKVQNRPYLLGNLNYYSGGDFYTLELSVTDQMTIQQLEVLHAKVSENFLLTPEIKVFLNTVDFEKRFKADECELPFITADRIYGTQKFQAIVEGHVYGKLKFYHSTSDIEDLGPTDIVVFKKTPDNIPPLGGLILNTFQTPLSHISILCRNRKTPYMALKDVWTNKEFESLEGQYIHLVISKGSYQIIESSLLEMETFWQQRLTDKTVIKLRADYVKSGLVDIKDLNFKMRKTVGAKAANFGELYKVSKKHDVKFRIPESGCAVPFYYYKKHLETSGAQIWIDSLLTIEHSDKTVQRYYLKQIRQIIKTHAVDPGLIKIIRLHMDKDVVYNRFRFRSSTNVEDIDGFNGAGLYTSKSAVRGDSLKTIEMALQKVWASTWNDRAFFERLYFGLDQSEVAMGVLIHRAFPNEKANGVAITKNIYRQQNVGFVINVQNGEIPVVAPPVGVECDQLLCYSNSDVQFYTSKEIIEYISRSNLTKGETVLSRSQVIELTSQLTLIKDYFFKHVNKNWIKYNFVDFALDIEFKITQDGSIYIKQVRPYK